MMPVPWRQTPSGTILVDAPADGLPAAVALYARVSSRDHRRDLDRQLARLSHYAAEHQLHVIETAAEVGSDKSLLPIGADPLPRLAAARLSGTERRVWEVW